MIVPFRLMVVLFCLMYVTILFNVRHRSVQRPSLLHPMSIVVHLFDFVRPLMSIHRSSLLMHRIFQIVRCVKLCS
jgi:hypothetical protein